MLVSISLLHLNTTHISRVIKEILLRVVFYYWLIKCAALDCISAVSKIFNIISASYHVITSVITRASISLAVEILNLWG